MDHTRKSTRRSPREKGANGRKGDNWTETNLKARMEKAGSSTELDLSHESLTRIPPAVFSLNDVEVLDVSDNPLGSVPVDIASLSHLKDLRAAGCDVKEVSGNISRCTYLEKVDLSRNPGLASLPASTKQLRYLKHVGLSGCELKALPENLTLLVTMETLDLSQNELTSLPPGMSALRRLRVLIISDNAFRTIPEPVLSLGRLECLVMKRNKLNNSRGDLKLSVPSHLKTLDMEGNYSLKVLPEGLENLQSIEELNASYCGLEALPDSIGKLTTVRRIHLAGNKLRALPASLGNLLSLETLDLEGNRRLAGLPHSLYHLRKNLRDKQTGTNTGLILDNCPALALPEAEVAQGNVVSVLVELLSEEILNKTSVGVAAEVVEDTIIEGLADHVVAVTEARVWDDVMSDVTGVVLADMECSEDIFLSVLEEDMPDLVKGIIEESVSEEKVVVTLAEQLLEETVRWMAEEAATDAVQVDDVARDVMEELLEECIMKMATEEATSAMQLDAASWEVMEAFMKEAQTLMLQEIATSAVRVDAGAWEAMEQLIEEGITEMATEMAAGAVQTDSVAWEELEDLLGEVTKAMTEEVAGSAVQQHAMAWDLMQVLLGEVLEEITQEVATCSVQLDAEAWDMMQVLLGEVTKVITKQMAASAVRLDAVAWEVMGELLEEVPTALLAAEESGVAPGAVQQDALAWEEMEEVLEEVTGAMSEEVATRAVRVDNVTREVMGEMIEEAKWMMTEEVVTDAVQVDSMAWEVMKKLIREVTNLKATATSIALEEHEEWHLVMDVMDGILDDISIATAKSVALEVDEEVRLGQTVPEEYNTESRHPISAAARAVQCLELPAGVRLAIPPGATRVDTSVISVVLNPHGADQTVPLGEDELLVSDILELRPAGLSFSRPVTLRIPHAVPRFHLDREFVVKTSEDGGKTWRALNTRSQHEWVAEHEWGQHFATVEVSHFSEFVVTARPRERFQSVPRGLSAELRSSPQTDVRVELPRDCGQQQVGFNVLPVDADTLACAAMAPDGLRGVGSMSHIVRFCKNLLLSSPATVVLPLAPGTGHLGGRVRVLSCDDNGRWEDITSSLDDIDIILQGSKVTFKSDQLRAGFAAVRCNNLEDPTATVSMVTKNIRARIVRIVIFKKWREPREAGVMTARIECVWKERVEDRICHMEQAEEFQRQDGTPTLPIVLMEGEDICVTFEGRIRPEGETNGHHGVNFTFYCERPRVLQFDVRLAGGGRRAASRVQVYLGRLENLPRRPTTPRPAPRRQAQPAPVQRQQPAPAPAPVVQQAPPPQKAPVAVQWPTSLATAEITPPGEQQAPPKAPVQWPTPLATSEITPPIKGMATAKSVALEVDEEVRLGQTVPKEYNKQSSHLISAAARAVQYLELPAGVRLAIPPGATKVDTSVISAVLNPHGAGQTVPLGEEELLVSDILELRPAGLSFSRPVTLRIPHAVPRFHLERQFVVKTSEDGGKTWRALNTRSQHERGQHFATVEVSHFSEFVVTARPLERFQSVPRGLSATLRSSSQTGVEVKLPNDCGPQQVGFKVLPVDADTLACAAMAPDGLRGVGSMSHIVRFCKNLLLSSPATVVLSLTPGTGHLGGRVRVLSCDDNGRWEDITGSLDDIVLQGSKVAFRTDQLRAGFAAVRCDNLEDPTATVSMVTKNIRARIVRIVIFKKWRDPREAGVMTARIECVWKERVEDRICHMEQVEGFERQAGTPTPPIVLMENEDICVTFEGRIRPDDETNGHHGKNFTFHCERPRVLQFDVRLAAGGRSAASRADNTAAGTPEAGPTGSRAEAATSPSRSSSPSCATAAADSKGSSTVAHTSGNF
uniref:Protein Sur-8 homolog n=1 Tax=Branchiostoma floridae TaxID=7739 RepID=C3YF90_BRAFL|eukprot:XP_002605082.1 hypothetical protein BRAFLDRAFT_85228 [Branchiostoma floridae]